jgi:hypothetical protein
MKNGTRRQGQYSLRELEDQRILKSGIRPDCQYQYIIFHFMITEIYSSSPCQKMGEYIKTSNVFPRFPRFPPIPQSHKIQKAKVERKRRGEVPHPSKPLCPRNSIRFQE